MKMYNNKVLLIDDEKETLNEGKEMLMNQGFAVDTFESGTDAWEKFQNDFYPVVVTDLRMAKKSLDGIDVLENIKRISPNTQVIIITGKGKEADAIKSVNLHAFAYLTKGSDEYFQLPAKVKEAFAEFAKLSDILLDNSPVAVTQEKPLSTEEVRELLKDYPSWGEAVLQERAEAN
jgi:DNA-binding NtrC family response regulator